LELFAFRDDYNADPEATDNEQKIVQLTDDATLDTHGAEWLLGDGFISFIGRRWTSDAPDATVADGGIYVMPLAFDTDGNIIGLGELPTTPTIPLPLVTDENPLPGVEPHPQPDVIYYSWDPTVTKFVYQKLSDHYGVWVADIDGTETMISRDPGHMAEWSPDGSRIVYQVSGGFVTIKPIEKSRLWLLRDTSTWHFYHAFWSPDSNYLVFTGQATAGGEREIFRVNANGGGLVQLTQAPYGGYTTEWNAGWR
jgi:dipeptidyl aminopeptidase/acylaminoacyl peptidase